MERDQEFQEAFEWLSSFEVHSEAEAIDKEVILSNIEVYEKMIKIMSEMIDNYDSQLVINSFSNAKEVREFVLNKVREDNKK